MRLVDKLPDHDALLLRDLPDDEDEAEDQDEDHSDKWFQRNED